MERRSFELNRNEEITRDSYDALAAEWIRKRGNATVWVTELEKLSGKLQGKRLIADFGSGSGRDTRLLTNRRCQYIGVDVSIEMLKQAKRYASFHSAVYIAGNITHLCFLPESFDGFLASCSLYHIPRDRLPGALREIRRVIKPGGPGFIVMREGRGAAMVRLSPNDQRLHVYYQLPEFKKILEKEGFTVNEAYRDTRHFRPPQDATVWLCYLVSV